MRFPEGSRIPPCPDNIPLIYLSAARSIGLKVILTSPMSTYASVLLPFWEIRFYLLSSLAFSQEEKIPVHNVLLRKRWEVKRWLLRFPHLQDGGVWLCSPDDVSTSEIFTDLDSPVTSSADTEGVTSRGHAPFLHKNLPLLSNSSSEAPLCWSEAESRNFLTTACDGPCLLMWDSWRGTHLADLQSGRAGTSFLQESCSQEVMGSAGFLDLFKPVWWTNMNPLLLI